MELKYYGNKQREDEIRKRTEELRSRKEKGETIAPAIPNRPGRSGRPEMDIDQAIKRDENILKELELEDTTEAHEVNEKYDKLKYDAKMANENLRRFRYKINHEKF